MINFLEVAAQQLPENFEYTTTHLRFENAMFNGDIKVLRGQYSNADQVQNNTGILGKIKKGDSHTTFTPLVPFDPEIVYTLFYGEQVYVFEIEKADTNQSLQITDIYPSVNQVPANILKWYIQFSKPVNPVKIYEHIQFLDQDNQPIHRSILNLGAPLLSADGMLLTIWVEPGRQKRMLGPNQHLGSVFEPSKKYTLRIASTLKDAQGFPIENEVTHTFTTLDADRIKPSLSNWTTTSLQANTLQRLEIKCEEQLDYGSLLDAFSLYYDGRPVAGTIAYDSFNKTIIITPVSNWKKGTYTIQMEPQLEDLAGNNLVHLFDRPVDKNEDIATPPTFALKVECL